MEDTLAFIFDNYQIFHVLEINLYFSSMLKDFSIIIPDKIWRITMPTHYNISRPH